MEYIANKVDFQYKNTAVALGKFEGLHRGHQLLFQELKRFGNTGMKSVVFTFDISPKQFISGETSHVIYTKEERNFLLDKIGMDVVISYPFQELRSLSPEEFVKNILVDRLDAKAIVVGEDFCFGYQRAGNVQLLKKLSEIYGYELKVIKRLQYKEDYISSSRIRKALLDGDLTLANQMLGYPYTFVGTVCHGRRIGHTIGIPTANIIPDENKYLPTHGVYVAQVQVEDEEKQYYGICNIGVKPTIEQGLCPSVETYMFDFQKDIYGKGIVVSLLQFVRPERKFKSVEELATQIYQDAAFGKKYVQK
ncbi:MAG: bifunctional riboflavin kinase/FAD synthetase [Firmicutes bacterium]|uniref:Riboflavin biosynthesis protein n=1 Tax=Candidatus Scybalomonas excrementavium TaxID=2840943 RepID=A0A9D9HZ60_9FIRM|nr:bifunctional riboflavin kinase/FAD synthetase [Candidatus Scybalomonas excrementavium]